MSTRFIKVLGSNVRNAEGDDFLVDLVFSAASVGKFASDSFAIKVEAEDVFDGLLVTVAL